MMSAPTQRSNRLDFAGRVALISGCGSRDGIGFACAAELALRGSRVAGASRPRDVATFAIGPIAFPAPAPPAPLTRLFAAPVERTQARTGYLWGAGDAQRIRHVVWTHWPIGRSRCVVLRPFLARWFPHYTSSSPSNGQLAHWSDAGGLYVGAVTVKVKQQG